MRIRRRRLDSGYADGEGYANSVFLIYALPIDAPRGILTGKAIGNTHGKRLRQAVIAIKTAIQRQSRRHTSATTSASPTATPPAQSTLTEP